MTPTDLFMISIDSHDGMPNTISNIANDNVTKEQVKNMQDRLDFNKIVLRFLF